MQFLNYVSYIVNPVFRVKSYLTQSYTNCIECFYKNIYYQVVDKNSIMKVDEYDLDELTINTIYRHNTIFLFFLKYILKDIEEWKSNSFKTLADIDIEPKIRNIYKVYLSNGYAFYTDDVDQTVTISDMYRKRYLLGLLGTIDVTYFINSCQSIQLTPQTIFKIYYMENKNKAVKVLKVLMKTGYYVELFTLDMESVEYKDTDLIKL